MSQRGRSQEKVPTEKEELFLVDDLKSGGAALLLSRSVGGATQSVSRTKGSVRLLSCECLRRTDRSTVVTARHFALLCRFSRFVSRKEQECNRIEL